VTEKFLILLAVHWVADFVLQTHWQASNKSRRIDALLRHVGVYTVCLMVVVPFVFPEQYQGWVLFIGSNGVMHFATDYCTSRVSSKLYAKQDWHNFFVIIGLDQLVHQVTLAGTMLWIFHA
jgi:hypothetical protein